MLYPSALLPSPGCPGEISSVLSENGPATKWALTRQEALAIADADTTKFLIFNTPEGKRELYRAILDHPGVREFLKSHPKLGRYHNPEALEAYYPLETAYAMFRKMASGSYASKDLQKTLGRFAAAKEEIESIRTIYKNGHDLAAEYTLLQNAVVRSRLPDPALSARRAILGRNQKTVTTEEKNMLTDYAKFNLRYNPRSTGRHGGHKPLKEIFAIAPDPAVPRLAAKEFDEVIKSDIAQYLLLETPEGWRILEKTTGTIINPAKASTIKPVAAYQKLVAQMQKHRHRPEYRDLVDRIRVAKNEMDTLRAAGFRGIISWTDQARLEEYAMSRLETGGPGRIRFHEPPHARPPAKIFSKSTSEIHLWPTARSAAEAQWQVRGFFRRMGACIRSMPAKEKAVKTLKTAFIQLGINEAFTVSAYVTASGGKNVDWRNLPIDLTVGGVASFVEPYLSVGSGALPIRYIKMVAFGTGKSVFEGGLFYVLPWSDTYGHDKGDMAVMRGQYSATWAVGNSAIKVGLFTFLLGMECLYPGGAMTATNIGIQLTHRIGSSVGYFYLRNTAFEKAGMDRKSGAKRSKDSSISSSETSAF